MSSTATSTRTVALERIHLPENVRDLDKAHVKALAGSMQLQGMLVPIVLRERSDGDFDLVAGFHRMAAAPLADLGEVPYVVREADTEEADRAVENIARKQLNPYEEAKAVRAMLDRNFTEDGAAQALGWPKARVTARMKLLELPERAQQLVGEGAIALAAVDPLRRIGAIAPKLLDIVVAHLDGNGSAAEQLNRDPAWVVGSALKHAGDRKVFAAFLTTVSANEIAELRLGKKTDQLYTEAEKLHKHLDPHAYGPPTVRFEEQDVDQARAAGVLIEFDNNRPIIVDRAVYRELVKNAITRTHGTLQQKTADRAAERAASKATNKPPDPATIAKRERDTKLRDRADEAHGVNTDLGHALMNTLASVDPNDMDVARFFVYALLGADHDKSPYIQSGDRVARIAAGGVRLVIEELRTDVTKTLKDGSCGRLRYDYGEHRDPQAAIAWLWKYLDGARTAADLYGRALVVIAAEQHASRLTINGSQRVPPTTWTSHNDRAAKALRKLCRSVIPASMTQLTRAVERAHAEYDQALKRSGEQASEEK